MCLDVMEVPASLSDGLVIPCFKRLLDDDGDGFSTWYQCCRVPTSGWLWARDPLSRSWGPRRWDLIERRAIHAVVDPRTTDGPKRANRVPPGFRPNETFHKAYAVQVLAYGKSEWCVLGKSSGREYWQDLACRGTYIPDADTESTVRQKRAIIKTLNKYAWYVDGTAQDLIADLPFLKGLVEE